VNKVKIGDLLTRVKEPIDIEEDKQYKRVTIKTNNQGVYLRDIEFGRNIGTKKQFIIHEGQFLLSKIDARNGAFGIVPNDLDGAIITGNFWAYEVNHELLNIEWFNIFVSSREFIDICDRASSGTTNRRYLDENKFLNFTISLPSFNEQSLFVENFKWIKQKFDFIMSELSYQYDLIIKLRQSILQEAVEGKLVPQDPNDEPASVLLEKIKEEKERLIKEGKIKKEKPLPPITEDEIPYELPKGWEWVRLGEIGETHTGTTPSTKHPEYFNGEIPFIKPADITDKGINYNNESLTLLGVNKGRLIPKDSVMMVCIGGSIGKCYYTDRDCSCNQQINAITAYGNMHGKFLYYFLSSPYFYKQVLARATGSATPIINKNKWSNILFPLPPLSEQKRIVEKVDQLMDLCDELEKNIEQSKKDSELLMQSVLQEVFKEA
jgi:type I restriction enzyme S subunit